MVKKKEKNVEKDSQWFIQGREVEAKARTTEPPTKRQRQTCLTSLCDKINTIPVLEGMTMK